MKPYTWVYLCSSPRRLKLTLDYLPANGLPTCKQMVIGWCSHLDPPERFRELAQTLAPYRNQLNFPVRIDNLSNLSDHCPDRLRRYFSNSKPRWALGVKLLIPFGYEAPLLYTDDDVLLLSDPTELMLEGGFGSCNFPFFKGNPKRAHICEQISEAVVNVYSTKTPFTMDDYDAHILDGGLWFAPTLNRTDYAMRLERFAQCPYLADLEEDSHEFRRIDQRFLTAYGFAYYWRQLKRSHERLNLMSHPDGTAGHGVLKNRTFVHYMTGQFKSAWMDRFERELPVYLQRRIACPASST